MLFLLPFFPSFGNKVTFFFHIFYWKQKTNPQQWRSPIVCLDFFCGLSCTNRNENWPIEWNFSSTSCLFTPFSEWTKKKKKKNPRWISFFISCTRPRGTLWKEIKTLRALKVVFIYFNEWINFHWNKNIIRQHLQYLQKLAKSLITQSVGNYYTSWYFQTRVQTCPPWL